MYQGGEVRGSLKVSECVQSEVGICLIRKTACASGVMLTPRPLPRYHTCATCKVFVENTRRR